MNLSIENKLQQIYDEKQTKLIPSNIKMGEEILGIRGNYTKDATATASNILNGYTAYVNGSKLTGTMPNNGTLNYTPTLQVQNIPAGYTTGGTINAVTSSIDSNITTENIRSGVTILGVNGKSTIVDTEPQSTTTDPTYTSEGETEFILDSETGYYEYSGKRKSGSLAMSFTTDLETDLILSYKGGGLLGDASVYVSLDSIYIDDLLDSDVYTTFTIPNVSAGSHIVEVNIPSMFGTTTLSVKMLPIEISEPMITTNTVFDGHVGYINGQKIIGNYIPLDTSDANATSGDIVNNMTAYVNGQKVVGNLESINHVGNGNTAMTNIRYAGPNGGSPTTRILVLDTISENDTNRLLNPHTSSSIGVGFYQLANFLEITPNKIKSRENILGVVGNVVEANLTNLNVTPSITNQSIVPNSPYNGFNVVNISAVTSNIDSNIQANNIKVGVNILNINGTFTSDANALVTDIAENKSAYVNGQKVTGNIPVLEAPFGQSWQAVNVEYRDDKKGQYLSIDTPAPQNILMRNGSRVYAEINVINVASAINLTSDKIKSGETILGIQGDSNIIDTSLPLLEQTATGSISLNQETGYYEQAGEGVGTLSVTVNGDTISSLILKYKGIRLGGSEATTTAYIDNTSIGNIGGSADYINYTIENIPSGNHVIKIEISSTDSRTTFSGIFLTPDIGINTNRVLAGYIGYVNGQKVVGNYNPINTSDATALVTDIANGKTAYVNGQKITGTLKNVSSIWGSNIEYKHSGGEPVVRISGITSQQGVGIIQNNVNFITYIDASIAQNQLGVNPNIILEGNDIIGVTGNAKELKGTNLDVTLSNINQSITPQSPYNAFTVVNIPAVTASIDNNITAANIKSGIKVLNITGNFTSDATAKVNEIISGKTAYVNGQKLVGTLNTTALYSTNAITVKNIANNSIRFSAGTPANVTVFNAGSTLLISSSYGQIANAINLQADQIKSGENILGVVGNVDSIKEYNSVNNMRNDSSAVANHSYGIELRSMNSTTYVDINYDSNRNNTSGFNRLNIVNSFTRSSTLDKSHYIGPINYSGDYDIYNSHISINSTNAYITIIGLNNECLLDAQYTSLDGNTYNISSLTGSCVQNNQFYYNVINLCTLRMMGEWVPLYDNTVFNCFLKPMEVQNITVEYPAALYKYDGTNWNKLMDKDDNITTINTTINCNLPNLNNV